MIVEIELSDSKVKKKCYILFDIEKEELWVPIEDLGPAVMLCAMFDGTQLMSSPVGKGNKEKTFVKFNWAINDWGGPENMIAALKKRQEIEFSKLDQYKNKYLKKD